MASGKPSRPRNPSGDNANIPGVYANTVKVVGGREEIVFLFGLRTSPDAVQTEDTVRLTDRIILNPSAAKRLSALLNAALLDYETAYGSLGVESFRPEIPNSAKHPFPAAQKTSEKARRLFQLTNDLKTPVGFERSFKMLDKVLLTNRFLLGFKKDTVREKPREKILNICEKIDMPAHFIDAFAENLPESNIVLFGFEENEKTAVYKAYLEFGGRFEQVIKENPDNPEPFLIHKGFKWDAADNTRHTMARYTCFPSYPVGKMLNRLSNVFYGREHTGALEITEGILNLASSRIGPDEFLYLEVSEENNPRKSFDINMYRANLRLAELYPLLSKMCRHFSVPLEDFLGVYEPVKSQIFGHLSGGIDREGRDFLTVYYGVKGSSVQ